MDSSVCSCLLFSQISEYSTSETAKSYDKAVQRKKHSRFNPNITLEKLKQATPQDIDETVKRSILLEFLEFKNLINNLDLDDCMEKDTENVISNMEVKSSIPSVAVKEIRKNKSLNEILELIHQVTTKQKYMSCEVKNGVLMLCDTIGCLQYDQRVDQREQLERKRTADVAV
ncbi:hypothetical protein J6590_033219 [Homalodisca vitripennis]|nr:hypothetical protein J6590_033219 [Homalodisca vitripennis]